MPDPRASTPPVPEVVRQSHDLRGVLTIDPFRRLWIALSLSSLGDWLGLLATAALATALGGGSYAAQSFAVAGVFIIRLLPAVLIGPLAGVVADRLDRRWTMVVGDLLRCALFLSIPLVGTLWWLYVASFLIECASLFWVPAKEATVPNLVPRQRLEAANQLSLLTTYGTAPVAALLFTVLSLFSSALGAGIKFFTTNPVHLALYFDAATFLFSALTIYRLREISHAGARTESHAGPSVWRTLVDGWAFVGKTPVVRGLVTGMLGAFAAGGAVVALAPIFVQDLGAGNAAYGVLFGTVFTGLAAGMFVGPRALRGFSRRRLFGLAIIGAGLALATLALVPNLVLAVLLSFVLGAFTGVGWVTGYTLLGLEVADEVRGRTFAFVQSLSRVVLVLVLAVAPLLAGAFGVHAFRLTDDVTLTYNGAAITLLLAAVVACVVGVLAFRQMDDRRGARLWHDLANALRGEAPVQGRAGLGGYFVAFEGGEGAGKSTQVESLAAWLRAKGHEVVVTHEPGATPLGRRLRHILLAPQTGPISARAEALLYAADRAEHVASVIRPALERGAVVVSDRYIDSSIAYQSGGRGLAADEVARISRWAGEGLYPDLTVLLDVPPSLGLQRGGVDPDRLEAEPLEFHERVRAAFLDRARAHPRRYLVVDSTQPQESVLAAVRERLAHALPLSPQEQAEVAERERLAQEQARVAAEAAARQRALEAERARLATQRQQGELARARAAEAEQRRAAEAAAAEQRRAAEAEAARAQAEAAARAQAEAAARAQAEAARAQAEAETAARRQAEAAALARHEEAARRSAIDELRHPSPPRAPLAAPGGPPAPVPAVPPNAAPVDDGDYTSLAEAAAEAESSLLDDLLGPPEGRRPRRREVRRAERAAREQAERTQAAREQAAREQAAHRPGDRGADDVTTELPRVGEHGDAHGDPTTVLPRIGAADDETAEMPRVDPRQEDETAELPRVDGRAGAGDERRSHRGPHR